MTRLNFAIAGAQRSATTSLKAAMAEHPEIRFLSNQREQLSYQGEFVGFPFTSPFASKSILGIEDQGAVYDAISEHTGEARYVGTKWPYFMIFPHIATNLRQHLGVALPDRVAWFSLALAKWDPGAQSSSGIGTDLDVTVHGAPDAPDQPLVLHLMKPGVTGSAAIDAAIASDTTAHFRRVDGTPIAAVRP